MDIQRLQSSWSRIAPNRERIGEAFFLRLFKADPSLATLFQNDSKTQGRQFAGMLNIVINGYEQLPLLEDSLASLGSRHKHAGVSAENIKLMEDTLVEVLREEIGDEFDKELEQTWRKIYETIVKKMSLL